jgi:hypothetical protein
MTLGNPNPSPSTKNQQAPGDLKSTAYKAIMKDNRQKASNLILGALNNLNPAGEKYSVYLAGSATEADITFAKYKASWGFDIPTDTPEANAGAGGCHIDINFPSDANVTGHISESIQMIYTNEPGTAGNATEDDSYLDNHNLKIPFYGGVMNSSPGIDDNSSRGWKKGTRWKGQVIFVNYKSSTKEIFMPPGASFEYSWDIKEQ